MSKFSLKQFISFLEVAHQGSVSRASENLHLTQPAITKQLNGLVQQLADKEVFYYDAKRTKLTTTGEQIYPYIDDIVRAYRRFSDFVDHQLKHEITLEGLISPTFADLTLETYIDLEKHSDDKLNLNYCTSPASELSTVSKKRYYDFILTDEEFNNNQYSEVKITEFPTYLVASPEHPLAKQNHIDIKTLQNQTFLITSKNSPWYTHLQETFDKDVRVQALSNFQTVKKAVLRDMGIAMLPKTLVFPELQNGQMVVLKSDLSMPKNKVHLYVPGKNLELPIFKELIAVIKELCKNINEI